MCFYFYTNNKIRKAKILIKQRQTRAREKYIYLHTYNYICYLKRAISMNIKFFTETVF